MSKAVAFIDWLSYTRSNDGKVLEYPSVFAGAAQAVVFEWQRFNEVEDKAFQETSPCKPNRPFQYARMDARTKSRIEWGGGSDRVFISFSGEGCKHLRLTRKTKAVLEKVCSDVTRLDLSVDIETTTSPMEFCSKRAKERHKNGSVMYSEEGQTQYVGSWASDRFARVYRYNPPHERSSFTRIEHVFKGKQAKILASKLVDFSPSSLLATVGEIYGWSHHDWLHAIESADTPEDVEWYKAEKRNSKTKEWLETTCVASIVRLVNEGEIEDIWKWVDEHIYAKLRDNGSDNSPGSTN